MAAPVMTVPMTITDKRLKSILGILLITVTCAVYWQVGSHGFINYDDPEYVYENPHVKAGLTFTGLAWAFGTFHAANWHPLTWLSHMGDVHMFGLNAGGHHLTSLILHAVNGLLLFLLLCRLTEAVWRSAAVAACFALHPLHVESVAWIAERKDLLSTFFLLLTLLCYARYAKAPGPERSIPVALAYTAGLMAKPMLVTLPFLLLLLDYWPLGRLQSKKGNRPESIRDEALSTRGRPMRELALEKLPFLILAGVSCVITLYAQQTAGAVKTLAFYPLASRVANALTAYVDYLYKMIWPHKLAVFYPFPKVISVLHLLAASCLLAGITAAAFTLRRKHPALLVGWLWYLGTLVPVIGLVQVGVQASADRYTYIPLIGIFIAIVWWLSDVTLKLAHRKMLLGGIAVITLSTCAVTTFKQVSCWRNDITLFSHALAVTDGNFVAQNNLGFALSANGSYAEADRHFREAIRIEPAFADAWLNMGDNLLRAGDTVNAIPAIVRAIELKQNFAAAYNDLGVALMRSGRLQEAMGKFTAALEIDPQLADGYYNMGMALGMQGKPDEAVAWFSRALILNPDNPEVHARMGMELARMKRFREASSQFAEALRLNPADAQARRYLERLSMGEDGNGTMTR